MTPALPHKQHGAALLVALVMLLLITLLATSSLRDSTLQNRLSGTVAERQHAANAAESALREGERRLQALANTGVSSLGSSDCSASIAALAATVKNLCVLASDRFADSSVAGTDWWTAATYATDYLGSDSDASFTNTPRWNTAYIGTSTTDLETLQQGKGTYFYRVSAAARADGKRFPVVRQSVYRITVQ
jgi:type IV pilus assembly protein PilX